MIAAACFAVAYVALIGGVVASCDSWWFRVFWIAAGLGVLFSVGGVKRRPASHLPDPPRPNTSRG